jgi:hypothetical protein
MLAIAALRSLMQDTDRLGQTMLQWMSKSQTPWTIDGEVGDLADDLIGVTPFLHYLRYDAPLLQGWLARNLDLNWTQAEIELIGAMDRPENSARLLDLGRRAAERQVKPEHFLPGFEPAPP